MSDLKLCFCGMVPRELMLSNGDSEKNAFASGDCCAWWNVSFDTGGFNLDSDQAMTRAVDEWNRAPRM